MALNAFFFFLVFQICLFRNTKHKRSIYQQALKKSRGATLH
ncbi:hypothetical protein HC081234_00240 [Helicobacter cinaedi]|nr:hypothetical protein HC081234_00240 [Helicobacter cinaedi]